MVPAARQYRPGRRVVDTTWQTRTGCLRVRGEPSTSWTCPTVDHSPGPVTRASGVVVPGVCPREVRRRCEPPADRSRFDAWTRSSRSTGWSRPSATTALDGLDLAVRRGEVHGFLGPNGAGKSTTIRVLLGLLRADAGDVRLLGGDPWRDAAELHRRLAYVPGRRQPVAEPHRRRGHRPARPAARRSRRDAAGRAARALRARPDQEGPHLLQGQPAEGRAGRGAGLRRRAARPRRADVRARPADGVGVPGVRRRVPRRGPHGAAVEPHPGRGRAAVRPGQHHPRRPHASSPARWPSCAT